MTPGRENLLSESVSAGKKLLDLKDKNQHRS